MKEEFIMIKSLHWDNTTFLAPESLYLVAQGIATAGDFQATVDDHDFSMLCSQALHDTF